MSKSPALWAASLLSSWRIYIWNSVWTFSHHAPDQVSVRELTERPSSVGGRGVTRGGSAAVRDSVGSHQQRWEPQGHSKTNKRLISVSLRRCSFNWKRCSFFSKSIKIHDNVNIRHVLIKKSSGKNEEGMREHALFLPMTLRIIGCFRCKFWIYSSDHIVPLGCLWSRLCDIVPSRVPLS